MFLLMVDKEGGVLTMRRCSKKEDYFTKRNTAHKTCISCIYTPGESVCDLRLSIKKSVSCTAGG